MGVSGCPAARAAVVALLVFLSHDPEGLVVGLLEHAHEVVEALAELVVAAGEQVVLHLVEGGVVLDAILDVQARHFLEGCHGHSVQRAVVAIPASPERAQSAVVLLQEPLARFQPP